MWVVNAEGHLLYTSAEVEQDRPAIDAALLEKLGRNETVINAKRQGKIDYYDVWVPLQMPAGVSSPGV